MYELRYIYTYTYSCVLRRIRFIYPRRVPSRGGPASYGLACTFDHVHWTTRDPSRSNLTRPQTGGPERTVVNIYIYIYI